MIDPEELEPEELELDAMFESFGSVLSRMHTDGASQEEIDKFCSEFGKPKPAETTAAAANHVGS